ncbi:4-hydroxy-tetrahydrodipicolinate synthase [compost metagenome]
MTKSIMDKMLGVKQKIYGGMIPAVPVPRFADGGIHHDAQLAYAKYLSKQQISGVAVWSHTGRGLYLNALERQEILMSWRSALGRDRVIVAGAGARFNHTLPYVERVKQWKREALHMAEHAVELGGDALLIFPPVIYKELPSKERDRCIVEYHEELSQLGIPLILFYLYEEGGGMDYSDEVLRKLLSLPSALGIKMATLDRVMTLQHVSSIIAKEHSDRLLISGEDRMFGYSLLRGARSTLMGLGAAYPNIQSDLLTSYQEKNYELFIELSSRIDDYAEATFTKPMDQYILRMLWCLVYEGVIPKEAANDIVGYVLTEEEIERLNNTIHKCELY